MSFVTASSQTYNDNHVAKHRYLACDNNTSIEEILLYADMLTAKVARVPFGEVGIILRVYTWPNSVPAITSNHRLAISVLLTHHLIVFNDYVYYVSVGGVYFIFDTITVENRTYI